MNPRGIVPGKREFHRASVDEREYVYAKRKDLVVILNLY